MDINQILRRSDELDDTIIRMLDIDRYPDHASGAQRMVLSVTAASLSIDHARALRSLVADGFVSSPTAYVYVAQAMRMDVPG